MMEWMYKEWIVQGMYKWYANDYLYKNAWQSCWFFSNEVIYIYTLLQFQYLYMFVYGNYEIIILHINLFIYSLIQSDIYKWFVYYDMQQLEYTWNLK